MRSIKSMRNSSFQNLKEKGNLTPVASTKQNDFFQSEKTNKNIGNLTDTIKKFGTSSPYENNYNEQNIKNKNIKIQIRMDSHKRLKSTVDESSYQMSNKQIKTEESQKSSNQNSPLFNYQFSPPILRDKARSYDMRLDEFILDCQDQVQENKSTLPEYFNPKVQIIKVKEKGISSITDQQQQKQEQQIFYLNKSLEKNLKLDYVY